MSTLTATTQAPEEDELQAIFLASMRKRFKAEINRMTRGDMLELLADQPDAAELSFLMSYVYAFEWLQHNVHANYQNEVLAAFCKGPQAFLMQMLLQSETLADFTHAYIEHWQNYQGKPQLQQHQLIHLLGAHQNNPEQLTQHILASWRRLGLFTRSHAIAYRDIGQDEKQRYKETLGEYDLQRLALVDAITDSQSPPTSFPKLGLIPAMGCPQTCRHCMFIFRPLMKDTPEPDDIYQMVNGLTKSVLFTGGDLTRQLDSFYQAIESMKNITTFAILLNGDFADTPEVTKNTLEKMARAIRRRPVTWPKAKIMLQISFDEFHQEVMVDKKGQLKERIPVNKIANIVDAAPRYSQEIQLCLLHKQHALNFSMDLFKKGVFARLAQNLGKRGHQLQILSTSASPRLKPNPENPGAAPSQLIKDASFILTKHPDAPIMLTSSTIDAYGRAETMDKNEVVNEKEQLGDLLTGKHQSRGDDFDTDLMFWFNGWVTLFSAVHMCLGDVYQDGLETVLKRLQKDPLTRALSHFDLKLLDYYSEIKPDLDQRIANATSPHHLFHSITEDAAMRLHMTKRLLASRN
ncbi:MAG: hypothetical protein OQL06_00155 [Gammaproteobacteria bacterium]|nr:hypothetical protein [Gammaproteobacteria bacterium]